MFIGHYALAFAAKKIDNRVSLGTSFIAVQLLDLVWSFMLLFSIEQVELNPLNNEIPLNFLFYPFSHSLLGCISWALIFGVAYYIFNKQYKSAILVTLMVFSHWALDFLVHIPDLQITPFSNLKVGLGLWLYKFPTFFFELILLFVGMYFYFKSTYPITKTQRIGFWILGLFLILIQISNVFGPPPTSVKVLKFFAQAQWLLIIWAYWIDYNSLSKSQIYLKFTH